MSKFKSVQVTKNLLYFCESSLVLHLLYAEALRFPHRCCHQRDAGPRFNLATAHPSKFATQHPQLGRASSHNLARPTHPSNFTELSTNQSNISTEWRQTPHLICTTPRHSNVTPSLIVATPHRNLPMPHSTTYPHHIPTTATLRPDLQYLRHTPT